MRGELLETISFRDVAMLFRTALLQRLEVVMTLHQEQHPFGCSAAGSWSSLMSRRQELMLLQGESALQPLVTVVTVVGPVVL